VNSVCSERQFFLSGLLSQMDASCRAGLYNQFGTFARHALSQAAQLTQGSSKFNESPQSDAARSSGHRRGPILATSAPLIETTRCAEVNAPRSGISGRQVLNLRWLAFGFVAACAAIAIVSDAQAGKSDYDAMVEKYARANGVPVALVHRVIVRES
jgi:hypothetical protein